MKKLKRITVVCLLMCWIPLTALAIDAEEIIRRVDQNEVYQTQKARVKMTVKRDGRVLEKEFEMMGNGREDQFVMEYFNPEDRGVKYLKIEDNLWIYLPEADDVMKISGHMLRQGIMGSDFSYEDMMSMDEYKTKYDSALIGEEEIDGQVCYVIELKGKSDAEDVTYASQKLYVDREKFTALKIEMYAKGGRKLKEMKLSGVKKFGNRYYQTRIEVSDMRKKNSVTVFEYEEIEFDVNIPDRVFSMRYLRR